MVEVSQLVSLEVKQKKLWSQLVAGLMHQCYKGSKVVPTKTLLEWKNVEFLTGPFSKFTATVETIDPQQRIWFLIWITRT